MKNKFFQNGKILFSRKQTNILSAAIILMVMILVSGILGLMRDRLLASLFFRGGKQWQLDIYFASFRIPDMIFQILILGTLSAAFIPVFSEYLIKNKKEANYFSCIVLNSCLLIYFILATFIFIFIRPLSQLITHNLSFAQLNLMVNLSRLLLLAQSFFVVSNFFTAILQSNQRFLLPALSAVLYNLGIILGIVFLTPILGIYGPVAGVIFGSFLHGAIQLPLLKNLGFHYRFILNFNHPGIKKIGRLMLPRTLSFILDQIMLNITVFIATSLTAGSLSIFNFAQHLSSLSISLFGLTIGQAALPSLSREATKNRDNFRSLFISSFHQILYLALPVSIILLILRVPFVRLVFGARTFPWQATILTAKIVGLLSFSIFSQGAIELLIRSFYAFQDTKSPLLVKGAAIILNIILSYWFVFRLNLGLLGLAGASSLTSFCYAGLLFLVLEKKLTGILTKEVFIPIFKMISACLAAGLVLWSLMRFLDRYFLNTAKTVHLLALTLIASIFGGVVYLFLSLILKIKELKSLFLVLQRFGHWRQILIQSEEVLDER